MQILVIDGQGGGIGRQLVAAVMAKLPGCELTAVGTNSMATAAMLKAGATQAATGENAVLVNARDADAIVGPLGIVVADAMRGEVTPRMARAIAQSSATRVLLPLNQCGTIVVGGSDLMVSELIERAVTQLAQIADTNQ